MQDFAACVTLCKAHDDMWLVNVTFQPQNPDSRNNHRTMIPRRVFYDESTLPASVGPKFDENDAW